MNKRRQLTRFGTLDLLVFVTAICVVLTAAVVDIRIRVPAYLTGGLDSYEVSQTTRGRAKSWHKAPWSRDPQFLGNPADEYAILQPDTSTPPIITKRFDWVTLSYDLLLTAFALLLVFSAVLQIRRTLQPTDQ